MDIFLATIGAKTDRIECLCETLLNRYFTNYILESKKEVLNRGVTSSIFYFRNKLNPIDPVFVEARRKIHALTGYTSEEIKNSLDIDKIFGDDNRHPILSPGGVYTFVNMDMDDGSICAGSSFPSTEVVYYQAHDGVIAISNRPLLAHLASRGRSTPLISNTVILDALPAAAFMDGNTSLSGCKRVPPLNVVDARPGDREPHVHKRSVPAYGNHSDETFSERRRAFSDLMIYAFQPAKRFAGIEFRLSGGKDSRALAAAISHLGIQPSSIVNHNAAFEVEAIVSDMVADAMGPTAVTRPQPDGRNSQKRPTLDEFVTNTRQKIKLQNGLPLAASLHYSIDTLGHTPGDAVLIGHAHIQRGGLAGPNYRYLKNILQSLGARVASPLVKANYSGRNFMEMRRFVTEGLLAGHIPEYLGLAGYVEWPLNHIFPPYHMYMSHYHHQFMPLMDERFCLYCMDLGKTRASQDSGSLAGILDLRNDTLMFACTKDLCPEMTRIPLADHTRYRFERGGASAIADLGEDFSSRDPELIKPGSKFRIENLSFRRMPRNEVDFLWSEIKAAGRADLPLRSWTIL